MDRGSFLRRLAAVVGVAVVDPKALLTPSEALSAPETVYFENGWRNARAGDLVASGGLCAPVGPLYHPLERATPVAHLMPTFAVERGGIKYKRPGA